MAQQGGRINFQVGFTTDQASVNQLKTSLQNLSKIKIGNFKGTKEELNQVKETAAKVGQALDNAFNVNLNSINVKTFNQELQRTGLSVQKIYKDFSQAGVQGQVAFSQMASSVLTTNLQLKETNSLISQMGETMMNTVKWGIASSVMNGFTQSVQSAFKYVESLQSSLTDIRIVTGDSTEQMEQFAQSANKAAIALGRSTLDYTKSALTFYQQGLDDEAVAARTEAVLKAQNITGAGSEMADYLTSVWNGYKVANEEAEVYVDKLAAVADSSASDMNELAIAMSKVASTANVMGVDIDQLSAQLATVIATTRMAPESVGTAFKTIFSRLNDIKTGAEGAETSLGNYSSKMASLGFNVLDANGALRDTGEVIEEIGGRWQDLTKEQQVYLAQTMGGQRQITQVMALFDNWGTYTELLNTSLESQGTLVEKNERYMESLGARMEQLGAAGERVKTALINTDDMKELVSGLTQGVNLLGSFIESIGGGRNALMALGSIATQLFSGTISKEINNIVTNLQNAHNRTQILAEDIKTTQAFGRSQGYSNGAIEAMVDAKKQAQDYYKFMSAEQINSYNNIVKQIGAIEQRKLLYDDQIKQAKNFYSIIEKASSTQGQTGNVDDQIIRINDQAEALKRTLDSLKGQNILQIWNNRSTGQGLNVFGSILSQVKELKASVGSDGLSSFTQFDKTWNNILEDINNGVDVSQEKLIAFKKAAEAVFKEGYEKTGLVLNLDEVQAKAQQDAAALKLAEDKANDFLKATKQFANVQTFVKMTAGLGQMASGLNNIVNLTKIWKNENLSTSEKLIQTFTNLSMTVGMLVNGYKQISESAKGLNALIKVTIATKELEATANGKVTASAITSAAANVTLGESLQFVATSALRMLTIIAPYALVIGGVVAAAYGLYKAFTKEEEAAKKAAKVAEETRKSYNNLKNEYNELKSSLENYQSAQDAISEMTQGTQEWRDAIKESNDAVLELINNYPALADKVNNVNGQLKISEEAQQEFLKQAQQRVQKANLASSITSQQSQMANIDSQRIQFARNNVINDVKNAQQSASGLVRQQISDADIGAITDALYRTLTSSDYTNDDLKNNFEGLTNKIQNLTGIGSDIISAVLSETDFLQKINTQVQNNTTAQQLVNKTQAASILANEKSYQGLDDLGKQIANTVGGEKLQQLTNDIYKEVKQLGTEGVNRFAQASNSNLQKILTRYNEATGKNVKYDSNAVTGSDDNRSLRFVEDGQVKTYTLEQVAATIAASQALQKLGTTADEAAAILGRMDDQVEKTDLGVDVGNLFKKFLSGQDLSDITLQDIGKIESQDFDLRDVFQNGQDAQQIADLYFDGSIKKMQQSWQRTIKSMEDSFSTLSDGAAQSVKTAFAHINKDTIPKDFQQMIVKDLSRAYVTGGQEGLDNLQKLYSSVKDFDAFDKVVYDFDFAGRGANALGAELVKSGAISADVINNVTGALQTYIDTKQAEKEVYASTENYAAIHDVIDDMDVGQVISGKQAEALEAAGVSLDGYFQQMVDGTWKLMGDANKFYQYANNISLEGFEKEIERLQKITKFQDTVGAKYQGINTSQFETSAVNANTGLVDKQKASMQLQALAISTEDEKTLSRIVELQSHLNSEQGLSIQQGIQISRLLQQHENEWIALTLSTEQNKQQLAQYNTMLGYANGQLVPMVEKLQSFNDLGDKLQSGEDLSVSEYAQYSQILDELLQKYPQLKDEVSLLQDTQLAGTRGYALALGQVREALKNISYEELVDKSSEAFDKLAKDAQFGGFHNIDFTVDDSQFETFKDNIQAFLDADHELNIAVHSDAEDEFLRLSTEFDNLYQAAGMIGENFTVAAGDLRELNNVFPGILQGMQYLEDGSVQLNESVVQRSLATAGQVLAADTDSVNGQLQNQANLLHAKAVIYRDMATQAGILATAEEGSEAASSQARAQLSADLADLQILNEQKTTNQTKQAHKDIADSAHQNAGTVAADWESASTASLNAVHNFAEQAVEYFKTLATANRKASQGEEVTESIKAAKFISGGYSGTGGTLQQTQLDKDLQDKIEDPGTSSQYWKEQQQYYLTLAEQAEKAENDILGMIKQNEALLNKMKAGYGNVAGGKDINGKTSGSKSGGGSKSEKQPNKIDPLKDEINRYHDIDLQLKQINTDLTKIQNQQKKLFGKDLLDNLNQQLKLLQKQKEATQEKIDIAKQQQKELRATLEKQDVQFAADGTISNYADILKQKLDAYNTLVEVYNNLDAESQKAFKDTVDAAKKEYEQFKKNIDKYDKLISETIPGLEKDIQDALDKQIEINIKKFQMKIELELDVTKAQREFNKFKKNVIDQIRDDNIAELQQSLFDDLSTYYNKDGLGQIEQLRRQVISQQRQAELAKTGQSSIYGDNYQSALDDLQKYNNQLMSSMQDAEDIIKNIKNSIFDAIDLTQQALDEQKDEYEYISELIDHDVNVTKLIYGEDAYDSLEKYYTLQEKNNNDELDFLKQQKQMWYERMTAEQELMSGLNPNTNAWKQANDRLKEYEKHWMESTSNLNSLLEKSIQNIIDKYSNAIKQTFDKLDKRMTGGRGLENIGEEWELINKEADLYLDKVNSMYEIDKLGNAYKEAINDSRDNVKAQQKLNDLMQQQLAYLNGKEKLSQYDVDRANALLNIERQRIALEEAQQSKSKLRLRRDSQGNYTYQYTSDQDEVAKAQQSLADAQNDLYNLTKQAYKNNLKTIYDTAEEYKSKIEEVYLDTTLTADEQQAKIAELNHYYGNMINDLTGDNEELKQLMMKDTFDSLGKYYDENVVDFQSMSDEQKSILMGDMIPYWNSGIQQMSDTFAGNGGFIPTVKQALNEADEKVVEYQGSLKNLEEAAGVNFKNIKDGIDSAITSTQSLLEENGDEDSGLIKSYKDLLTAINDNVTKVGELEQAYVDYKTAAVEAATAAADFVAQAKLAAAEQALDPVTMTEGGQPANTGGVGEEPPKDNKNDGDKGDTGTGKDDNKGRTASADIIEGIAAAIWIKGQASGWGNNPVRSGYVTKKFNAKTATAVQQYINQHGPNGDIYAAWKSKLDQLSKYYYSSFRTGGYTGAWGNSGKLGILHEKEIVLNQSDTANLLTAVNIVRSIDDLLSGISGNVSLPDILGAITANTNTSNTMDQNVHIEAHFPNVRSHSEIEDALNNLVNRASQYVYNTRKA